MQSSVVLLEEQATRVRLFQLLVADKHPAPMIPGDAAVPAPAQASMPAIAQDADAEDPATHKRILELLSANGATFGTLVHAPTKTSQESADVRGVPLSSGAKAILLKNKKDHVLCVMSASQTLDFPAVRKLVGSSKLCMASLEDVKKVTGCINGAVPPFGSLFGIRTYVDRSIISQGKEINFNAGLRTFSVLHLQVDDYLRIEGANATVESFTTASPTTPAATPAAE